MCTLERKNATSKVIILKLIPLKNTTRLRSKLLIQQCVDFLHQFNTKSIKILLLHELKIDILIVNFIFFLFTQVMWLLVINHNIAS